MLKFENIFIYLLFYLVLFESKFFIFKLCGFLSRRYSCVIPNFKTWGGRGGEVHCALVKMSETYLVLGGGGGLNHTLSFEFRFEKGKCILYRGDVC